MFATELHVGGFRDLRFYSIDIKIYTHRSCSWPRALNTFSTRFFYVVVANISEENQSHIAVNRRRQTALSLKQWNVCETFANEY